MSNIRTVVTEALRDKGQAQYISEAEPIIFELEAREAGAVAHLREIAARKGLRASEVESALIEVGLAEEPEPVDPRQEAIAALQAEVESLQARLQELIAS